MFATVFRSIRATDILQRLVARVGHRRPAISTHNETAVRRTFVEHDNPLIVARRHSDMLAGRNRSNLIVLGQRRILRRLSGRILLVQLRLDDRRGIFRREAPRHQHFFVMR